MRSAFPFITVVLTATVLVSCDRDSSKKSDAFSSLSLASDVQADIPILPVSVGDQWTYDVVLEIPADVTAAGAPEVKNSFIRTRTYLGKIAAATGLPAVDCFEVLVPGSPKEREFVEIDDDKILMRGSLIMGSETVHPLWLDPPVPFVVAGMRPGTELPEIKAAQGAVTRKTQVIAREDVTVPAGKFASIRILTTGTDGDMELRLTRWFSPGNGIIREEKTRYRLNKLIFRETQELKEILRGSEG